MMRRKISGGGRKLGGKKEEGFYCFEKRVKKKTFLSALFLFLSCAFAGFFFFPLLFPLSPRDCVEPCIRLYVFPCVRVLISLVFDASCVVFLLV